MHKFVAGLVIAATAAMLGGCYDEPGYSYVRGHGGGDAYYGQAVPVYDDGYYAVPAYEEPGDYDGYGGGYYGGCCYSPGVVLGIGGVWRGGPRYRHGDDRRYDDGHRGVGYHGGHDGDRGNRGRHDRPSYYGGHRGAGREGGWHPGGRGGSPHGDRGHRGDPRQR
jgi:hypothetical protein